MKKERTKAYQQVVSLLHGLDKDELKDALEYAKALQSMPTSAVKGNGKPNGAEKNQDEIVQSVYDVGLSIGIGGYFTQLTTEAAKSQEKLQIVRDFIAPVHSKASRLALLRMGIEMVYEYLSWMNLPVTGATVIRNIHVMPALFDRHFPAYAKCGMLEMIVRKNDTP